MTDSASGWRTQLERGRSAAAEQLAGLGLLFQLRTLVQEGSRWTAPQAKPATTVRRRSEQRLAVRPVLRSDNGTWTTGPLSWRDLSFKVERLRLDPAQIAWFSQFQALHRATTEGYAATEPDWLYLDAFDSPLLWALLDSGRDLGLTYLADRAGHEVAIVSGAHIVLDISADGGGALRLNATAVLSDDPLPVTGLIGNHGISSVSLSPAPTITIAPIPTGELAALSWDPDAMRIPASDTAEFWRSYAPQLARHHRFRGQGIELPPVTPAPDPSDETDTTEVPRLRLTPAPGEGNDWFDLRFILTVGPYTIPLADIFTALSNGKAKLRLVDGTHLPLNQPMFDVLRDLIADGAMLREWEVGKIAQPHQAHLLEPFEDRSEQSPAALAWRETARALVDPPPQRPAPATLDATLRPYQLAGYHWLAHLNRHGLGGILADDMGLGKTIQTIAMLLDAAPTAAAPALVVTPTSVVGTWADEFARFAPGLRIAVVASGTDPIPDDADVVVASYTILRLWQRRFTRRTWSTVILDEAQTIKNPASQIHESVRALRGGAVFALTGTPLENGLLDLWAILRVVAPGLFPSRIRFTDRYVKTHSAERIAQLRTRIRPLMLRRTKAAVAPELPEKQEQHVLVDLSPEHRAIYDRYLQRERQKILGLVEDLDRHRFIVFRSLTLLRRLALDPRLIDADTGTAPAPSAKLEELIDRIAELAAEGRRALVFSQFTSYLALVRERLEASGIAYAYLDGSTTDRRDVVDAFRSGEDPVFLISLRAGGVGLTLTEADTVFLLDPWWNPAAENQAIDRAHRIGQDRPVFVYRLVARDTIEEKVLALAESKRALFDEVVDDGDVFTGELTAADVRMLLA